MMHRNRFVWREKNSIENGNSKSESFRMINFTLDHQQSWTLSMVAEITRNDFIIVFLGKHSHSNPRRYFSTNLWWQSNFVNFNNFIGSWLCYNTFSGLLWSVKSFFFSISSHSVKLWRSKYFFLYFYRWCNWIDINPIFYWIFARPFDSEHCIDYNCLDSGWRASKMLCSRLYGH